MSGKTYIDYNAWLQRCGDSPNLVLLWMDIADINTYIQDGEAALQGEWTIDYSEQSGEINCLKEETAVYRTYLNAICEDINAVDEAFKDGLQTPIDQIEDINICKYELKPSMSDNGKILEGYNITKFIAIGELDSVNRPDFHLTDREYVADNINIMDTIQNNFGFDVKTVQLMNKVYFYIQLNYLDKTQIEKDYIFLRMMGGFNYGEDGIVDDLEWNQTADEPIYVIEGMSEMSYYTDKIGLTEAEYIYLRYKVRIQNVLASSSSDLTWNFLKDKKNFDNYKIKFKEATGLEFNEENWMAQYNSLSGHGDFAHQMITMATLLSESGWIADLYTGGEEMTDHNSGWFGDVTINGQLGNDDYCADLDAVNIAAMMKNGQNYIDAMNQYYSEVGTEYTRAEKFVENIPLERVESLLKGHYYSIFYTNLPIYVDPLEIKDLKELAPKAYNFIRNLQDKNNIMIDY